MKQQLDIFGAEGEAEAAGKPSEPKARAKRQRGMSTRMRPVKKAPMIVDSFEAKQSPSPLMGEGRGEGDHPPLDPLPSREGKEAATPHVHTVSEITARIKGELEAGFTDIWVTGEVTDFKGRKGQHYYFALKDEKSQIRAIIWSGGSGRLPFELEDGLKLICRGQLNVYEPRGTYSLIVDPAHCEPEGIGALKLAFEQLKKKLEAEGLFARERKRKIPFLPRRIGIVTAPTGAAIRDLIHVLSRRYPPIEILLAPVRVQGEGAAAEIAAAIERLNQEQNLDVLIVGRGGGSIEDLWCFNEEVVARAIAASRIPVISAVGHEIDFTIADFVADLRAATPSAAAELAVPVYGELVAAIAAGRERLAGGLRRVLENRWLMVKRLEGRLGDPRRRLPDLSLRIDHGRERAVNAVRAILERRTQHLAKLMSNLDHLSPLGVLAKGYAVVEGPDGLAIREAAQLRSGDDIRMRFHKGRADAKVTKIG